MKTHLIMKSFSELSIEQFVDSSSNQQPLNYSESFSPSVAPERTTAQALRNDSQRRESEFTKPTMNMNITAKEKA
jgi:hypothetical protein